MVTVFRFRDLTNDVWLQPNAKANDCIIQCYVMVFLRKNNEFTGKKHDVCAFDQIVLGWFSFSSVGRELAVFCEIHCWYTCCCKKRIHQRYMKIRFLCLVQNYASLKYWQTDF